MESENSNPETLADLSKHLRDWADRLPEEESCAWFERPVEQMQEILRDIADKIDAAWKLQMSQSWHNREMTDLIMRHEKEVMELKKSFGNSAELRKALELCIKEMCMYCRNEMIARGLESTCVFGCETLNIARSALDAPMRNCDRFDTWNEAWDCWFNLPSEEIGGDYGSHHFMEWLFSPVTDEGGAK